MLYKIQLYKREKDQTEDIAFWYSKLNMWHYGGRLVMPINVAEDFVENMKISFGQDQLIVEEIKSQKPTIT